MTLKQSTNYEVVGFGERTRFKFLGGLKSIFSGSELGLEQRYVLIMGICYVLILACAEELQCLELFMTSV